MTVTIYERPEAAPPKRRTGNAIISIVNGVASVDVSTGKYPDAIMLIDECDLESATTGCRWGASAGKLTLYATRRIGGRANTVCQLFHRVVLCLTDRRIQGDHINGDGLDNRRCNLRVATNEQNARNGRRHRDGSSIFKGVSFDKERGLWQAGICLNGKRQALGRFADEVSAALEYDEAARLYYGDFAKLNFTEQA